MEIIKINDPKSGKELVVQITPVDLEENQGWKLRFEDGKEAILTLDQHRIWKEVGAGNLDPGLISHLGNAIDNQLSDSR